MTWPIIAAIFVASFVGSFVVTYIFAAKNTTRGLRGDPVIWPIIATAVISFASGAALATWWHRTEPERRREALALLNEIFEGLD